MTPKLACDTISGYCGAILTPQEDAMEGTNIKVLPDGRLDRSAAAKFLGFKEKTLAEWQRLGKGPPSIKVGGRRFYKLDALRAFVDGETA
jgi:helix-turn-helix protein